VRADTWVRFWPSSFCGFNYVFYSIMADAQYVFIIYSCILYIEKACRSVVVLCVSSAKVQVFEPWQWLASVFNVFIFFSFFFNCGVHELLQSNFSLLIHDAEI